MGKKVEKKVSLYDPAVDAYREVSLSSACKMIESAKQVEKQLKKKGLIK